MGDKKQRMLEIIRKYPGIRPRDLNKRLGMEHSANLLETFIKKGLVRKIRKGDAVHYYPGGKHEKS